MESDRHIDAPILTAHAAGLIGCQTCGAVSPGDHHRCRRCGTRLKPVDRRELQAVWAWLVAGLMMYVPANIYPMLRTRTLLEQQESTILGGVVQLWAHGSWGIAFIVFFASIMIPIGKFLAIGYLAICVQTRRRLGRHGRLRLYEVVEFIGRWSMIDVFVVAILSALVQLGFVASVHPGPAAAAFALSVAFTMLSAQAFDPRAIWEDDTPSATPAQGNLAA
jgi:paraquat-inducible protein A